MAGKSDAGWAAGKVPWARASELDRVTNCPAATHLVRVEDRPGAAAEWGNVVHAWKETGEWPNTAAARRRSAALAAAGIRREDLWPAHAGRHEVAFSLNTATCAVGTHSGPQKERDDWKAGHGDDWVVGTADWVGDLLGAVWVDDLKTGRAVPSNPWDLWQLRFYAACAALGTGRDVVASITWWPRSPADGPPVRRWGEYVKQSRLLVWVAELEMARTRAYYSRAGEPLTEPGAWCDWCRCRPACPEYVVNLPGLADL